MKLGKLSCIQRLFVNQNIKLVKLNGTIRFNSWGFLIPPSQMHEV